MFVVDVRLNGSCKNESIQDIVIAAYARLHQTHPGPLPPPPGIFLVTFNYKICVCAVHWEGGSALVVVCDISNHHVVHSAMATVGLFVHNRFCYARIKQSENRVFEEVCAFSL